MLQNISVLKQMLFFWTVREISDNNNNCFMSIKSAYSMISEGSCDTEDRGNDAVYSALTSQE